nr:MAG TPA: hypothetical protein [Caudoviricetes sp.]
MHKNKKFFCLFCLLTRGNKHGIMAGGARPCFLPISIPTSPYGIFFYRKWPAHIEPIFP